MTPEAKLADFAHRIHLQDDDVDYLLSLLQEARGLGSLAGAAAEREACVQVARDIEAGAGIVNDAEGHPVCEHCCQECLAGRIADAIAARNDA